MIKARQWIKDRLDATPSKSAKELAEKLGLDAARISEMISGIRNIKSSEIPVFAEYMDMTEKEVIDGFNLSRVPLPRNKIAQTSAQASGTATTLGGGNADKVSELMFGELLRANGFSHETVADVIGDLNNKFPGWQSRLRSK